jgi:hypothetical protein
LEILWRLETFAAGRQNRERGKERGGEQQVYRAKEGRNDGVNKRSTGKHTKQQLF